MEIKELINKCVNFSIKKFKELLGLSLSMMGLLLLIALISYSPEDPNFIFPQNMHIQNILGFKGSFTSDIFFQSLGFISIAVPFTIFFTFIISLWIKSRLSFDMPSVLLLNLFIFFV